MKLRTATVALALAAPIMLHPALDDAIRGFDPASQSAQAHWESEARRIPDAARIGEFIRKLLSRPHLAVPCNRSRQPKRSLLSFGDTVSMRILNSSKRCCPPRKRASSK